MRGRNITRSLARWFLAAFGSICLLALTANAGASEFGRYRALVIGINDYRHVTKLVTAVDDATAMHVVLRQQYGFESELLLNPDRYTLVRKLDELRAELEPEDNLVIYYAGHGILDRGADQGYWLPVDAEEDSQANWVSVSTVTGTLRAMAAKHVLVIADSCYSGTLTRNAPVRLETGGDRLEELKRLSAKRARKALTSGGLEPVVDSGSDGHSVFTGALLGILRSADQPLDGYNLFTRLRRAVVVNADQTPSYGEIRLSGDEGGDFVFLPVSAALPEGKLAAKSSASGPVRSPGRTDKLDLELAFWDSIRESKNPGDFTAYLKQYPDGAFAELALARVEALRKSEAPAPSTEPAAAPGVEMAPVDRLEGEYTAVAKTVVRRGPGSEHAVVTTLAAGERIDVTGKVQRRNWLQLGREGRIIGYAYAVGLQPSARLDKIEDDRARHEAAARRAREEKAAAEQQTKAEEVAAYQRYLEAERRKENLELQRERTRRYRPYGGNTIILQR